MNEPKKNTRVRQACDYCRTKKAKCDGALPVCSTCSALLEVCTYTTSRKRRGLPSGYTHELERRVLLYQTLLGQLVRDARCGECLEALEQSLAEPEALCAGLVPLQLHWRQSRLAGLVDQFVADHGSAIMSAKAATTTTLKTATAAGAAPAAQSTAQGAAQSTAQGAAQGAQRAQRARGAQRAAKVIATGGSDSSAATGAPGASGTDGDNLLNDPFFFLKTEILHHVDDTKATLWRPVALQYHGLLSLISGFSSSAVLQYRSRSSLLVRRPFSVGSIFHMSLAAVAAAAEDPDPVPAYLVNFPADTAHCLERYFQVYHPWFPVVNRVSLMGQVRRFEALGRGDGGPAAPEYDSIALIWIAVALGALAGAPALAAPAAPVAQYACNCVRALERSVTTSVETTQSMVMLGVFYYQTGDWERLWVLISSATRMAMDVKLMARPTVGVYEEGAAAAAAAPLNPARKRERGNVDSITGWVGLTPQLAPQLAPLLAEEIHTNNINRERTWACVYIANTLLLLRLGRLPLVRAAEWPVPFVHEDAWEEWEGWTLVHPHETASLDCARLLLNFNQLLQVVALVNLALTATIDISEATLDDCQQDGDLHRVRPGALHTLAYFRKRLGDWLAELPLYFRLEAYPATGAPPFVAFLHLCHSLAWCIICIRLSELKISLTATFKDRIVEMRDREYTRAVVAIRAIVTRQGLAYLKDYPFVDYFMLMAVLFPNMMQFGSAAELEHHTGEMRLRLEYALALLVPCEITHDVYSTMEREGTVFGRKRAALASPPPPKAPRASRAPSILSLAALVTRAALRDSAAAAATGLSAHDRLRRQPFTYQPSGKNKNFDSFMIDLDLAKAPKRQQAFIANMGFLAPPKPFDAP